MKNSNTNGGSNCGETTRRVDAGPIIGIIRALDPEDQLEWLKKIQDLLCGKEEWYEFVVKSHSISECAFIKFTQEHPENAGGIKYSKISLRDLENRLSAFPGKCYDKHVEFDLTQPTASPDFMKFVDFNPDASHYSIPLLKGIINEIKKQGVSLNTNLELCNSVIGSADKVIFKVNNVGFFDLSGDPGFVSPEPLPL